MSTPSPALEGLRVVELGCRGAAACAGALLAEQGAELWRVLPLNAPEEGPAARARARGKGSVQLDLRDPDQQDQLLGLLAHADVLLDGLRPGVRASRGLADERLLRANPRLVIAGFPGFARDDARRAMPGWEGLVGAAAGLYDSPAGGKPRWMPVETAGVLAAAFGVAAVAAALLARDRDGAGQRVEVPLFDAAMSAQEVAALLTHKPPRTWTTLAWAATPFMGTYRCQDDRWLYLHLGVPGHLPRFLRLLDSLNPAEAAAWRADISEDTWRQPSEPGGVLEARRLTLRMRELMASRPASIWERDLQEAGLCGVVCRQPGEWLEHRHARRNKQVVTLNDPVVGELRQPGAAVRLAGAPPVLEPGALVTPFPELLHRWQQAQAQSVAPQGWTRDSAPDAPPLRGLRVLDLSQVIAGPTLARTLAELGAEVLRVENPRFNGTFVQPFHLAFNPGKRSAVIDMSSEQGRQALWALIDSYRPDVLVESFAAGVLDRLGFTEEALRERLPRLVLAQVSAYDREGPWGGFKGWEQTAQAITGTQVLYGGKTPDLYPLPANDLGTGVLGAFGVLAALRRGAGETVQVSLVRTSLLLQTESLVQPPAPRPEGRETLGSGALERFYRTKDGWIFLAGAPGDLKRLAQVEGLQELATEDPTDLERFLERRIRLGLSRSWVRRVQAVAAGSSLGVHPRTPVRQALRDPVVLARKRLLRQPAPGGGEVSAIATPMTMSRTELIGLEPAGVRGADSGEVFKQHSLQLPAPQMPTPPSPRTTMGRLARDLGWVGRQLRWLLFVLWRRKG